MGKNVGSLSYFQKKEKKVSSHSHFACAKAKNKKRQEKKDMVNKNVLLIIETSFYLENSHIWGLRPHYVRPSGMGRFRS